MPLLIQALLGALAAGAGTIVGRVLISLGIGYIAYTGLDTMVGAAKTQFVSSLQGLPGVALQIASVMQLGVCVSILTSAFLTRLLLRGLSSGAVTKMVMKG